MCIEILYKIIIFINKLFKNCIYCMSFVFNFKLLSQCFVLFCKIIFCGPLKNIKKQQQQHGFIILFTHVQTRYKKGGRGASFWKPHRRKKAHVHIWEDFTNIHEHASLLFITNLHPVLFSLPSSWCLFFSFSLLLFLRTSFPHNATLSTLWVVH